MALYRHSARHDGRAVAAADALESGAQTFTKISAMLARPSAMYVQKKALAVPNRSLFFSLTRKCAYTTIAYPGSFCFILHFSLYTLVFFFRWSREAVDFLPGDAGSVPAVVVAEKNLGIAM